MDAAKIEIFDKGWHFVAPVSHFSISETEKSVQFDFFKRQFFGLCNISDLTNAQGELYYGNLEECFEKVDMKDTSKVEKILETLPMVNSVTTKMGLVFICHEKTPEKSFEDYFGNQLGQFIDTKYFRQFPLRRSLVYETEYNLMTFIDGYQDSIKYSLQVDSYD